MKTTHAKLCKHRLLALISFLLVIQSGYVMADVKGQIHSFVWESKIIPNTLRNYYLYIPPQYSPKVAAALMVFQDGHHYMDSKDAFQAVEVMEKLIDEGAMPVTIGLFVDPGYRPGENPPTPWENSNRRAEYDALSDDYVRMLVEELIPEVAKSYHLTNDKRQRGIGGTSSGGICAFTAAWHRPDYFHKVITHIGSFVDILGGHNYPSLIRKGDFRDMRIFMQAARNDLNNEYGDWWLGNLQMESALKFRDYDYRFVATDGEHNSRDGGRIFEESMRWLWRD